MKNLKKIMAVGTLTLVIGATSFASLFAAPVNGNGAATRAHDAGRMIGSMSLEAKAAILDSKVAAGTMTAERATEIKDAITANQATCDGTGTAAIGQEMGAGFGSGGRGDGTGLGAGGSARGQGAGGMGLRDRSCY